MGILFRLIIMLVGIGVAAGGGWVAWVGYADSVILEKPRALDEIPYPQQARRLVLETREVVRGIPKEYRDHLNTQDHRMLYPLGGVGGFVCFIGLVIFLNGAFRRKQPAWAEGKVDKTDDDNRISDELISSQQQAPAPAAAGDDAAKISIDEAGLDVTEDEAEKLRDVNYLVTIGQSDLESDTVKLIFHTFRPELERYIPLFNDEGAERFAHQILNSIILRHRRHSRDITPDQFQVQDQRITECERETVCHRYMPSPDKLKTDMHSDEAKQHVGKVYDSYTRSSVQKNVSGEADDWRDVSLRNAVEVLSAKTALEPAAA